MSVLVLADSLAWHGPERAELLTDPRLWPNLMAADLGVPVEVVGRAGFTAREAWWALTKDPRVYSLLLPQAQLVMFAVGNMDQLPVGVPTYLREGMAHLPTPRLRAGVKTCYGRANPLLVKASGGRMRVLPQRLTDYYLTMSVQALRALRPALPVLGVIPPLWSSPYYPSTRPHAAAVRAARAWGQRLDVPLVDWEAVLAPFVPGGLNRDGLHWGWPAHRAVAAATGPVLAGLLNRKSG